MDFILFLTAGLVVLIIAISRNGRGAGAGNTTLHRPGRGRAQRAVPRQKPVRPFDGQSARPVPKDTVLKGKAFIVDGDTVIIRKTQIRLFGIDAPELTHPYGKKAKWALVSLCKGQRVEAEVMETDAHGRTVAKCRLEDGRDLSAEMVKLGLAIDWPRYSNGVYARHEVPGIRKTLWLADARQKGHWHVWERFETNLKARREKETQALW